MVLVRVMNSEGFSTRREKASVVANWLNDGGGDYKSYRESTSDGSNIVEYYDVKRALADKTYVSADDVMKVL
jgi:hypothetical protein